MLSGHDEEQTSFPAETLADAGYSVDVLSNSQLPFSAEVRQSMCSCKFQTTVEGSLPLVKHCAGRLCLLTFVQQQ